MKEINLQHVHKYFYHQKSKAATAVLFDINYSFKSNRFYALVGPSGCGKTTLLKTIAGIYQADEGSVLFDQIDTSKLTQKQKDIAFVSQEYALYPTMTIFDNIAYPLKLQKIGIDEITQRVKEVATLLDIDFLLSRKPKVLSGGQQQRVAIARALIRKPSVLLLDEPLSNIDPLLKQNILKKIKSWQTSYGFMVIYTTHQLSEINAYVDEIIHMHNGTVITREEIGDKHD